MDYPKNIYMSPRNTIARFNALLSKHGEDAVVKSGAFKEEKELLVAGQVFMAIQKVVGYKYYLRPAEDIAADIDVRAITWGKDGDAFEEIDIQITEFENHSKDLLEVIQKKIEKQAQVGDENRDLIVNIRERDGEKFYPAKIAKAVEAMEPHFKSIWLLIKDYEGEWLFHAISIWPTPNIIEVNFDLEKEFENQTPPDYVRISRGAHNKLLSENDTYELPLP